MKYIVVLFVLLAATYTSSIEYPKKIKSPPSPQFRIAGGEYSQIGQFPHQVAVQTHRLTKEGWDTTSVCGGSLISRQYVLTASHCLHGGIYAEAFLGATNLTGFWIRKKIEKENIIMHEQYDNVRDRNDIALVRLPEEITLSNSINTINLPRLSQRNLTFEISVGWILGWGRLGDGEKSFPSTHLRYARRWILPNSYCPHYLPSYNKSIHVCVDGSHGISACIGDSGGPVFIEEEDGSRTVVGIAAFERIEGCEKDFPVAFTRVTAYFDWILEKTGIQLRP